MAKKKEKVKKVECSECKGTRLDPRVPVEDNKPCPNCVEEEDNEEIESAEVEDEDMEAEGVEAEEPEDNE